MIIKEVRDKSQAIKPRQIRTLVLRAIYFHLSGLMTSSARAAMAAPTTKGAGTFWFVALQALHGAAVGIIRLRSLVEIWVIS
jgi:hypothetical protein